MPSGRSTPRWTCWADCWRSPAPSPDCRRARWPRATSPPPPAPSPGCPRQPPRPVARARRGRLLEIARAESGLQKGQMAEVDLAAVAGDVAELYEPTAEDRGLVLEVSAGEPIPVAGHAELLAQAVSNLVDNATKYARGRIRVTAMVVGGRPQVRVAVDGPVFPAQDRQLAVVRVLQLDPHRPDKCSGGRSRLASGKTYATRFALGVLHDSLNIILPSIPYTL